MSPMRKKIASRLVEAQQTAALLTTFNEVDMSAVMGLRKTHQDKFVKKYETKLGFMSFFIKATVDALKLVPQINAEIRDNAIVYRHYADIGVAVGGGKGLVVPVIRNAERLSFADIAHHQRLRSACPKEPTSALRTSRRYVHNLQWRCLAHSYRRRLSIHLRAVFGPSWHQRTSVAENGGRHSPNDVHCPDV